MKNVFLVVLVFSLSLKSAIGQWNTNPSINNLICSQPYEQTDIRLVTDKREGAILTWSDSRNDPNLILTDIYAQRVSKNGVNSWQADGVAICTEASKQSAPVSTTDGNGGAIIAWNDYRNGNQDIYAQRVDSSGNIMWAINGAAIINKSATQQGLKIKSDGANGAFLIWEDSINGNWDIYAQRINGNGTPQWTSSGVIVCDAVNDQKNPKLAVRTNGEIVITWQDKRNGQDYDIYAQKLSSFGVLQWSANGIPIAVASNSQVNPKIKMDSAQATIIAWQDKRFGDYDIYAQRVGGNGSLAWAKNGIVVCDASGNQSAIDMSTENIHDGILISWKDGRANKKNIYCQKVNYSGNSVWTNNGLILSEPTRLQIRPNITGDGNGGGIVVWQDSLTNDWDIYSQHVSSDGTIQWAAGGVAIASANNNQTKPKNISDGNGGSIYCFKDKRSGDFNVYAYKFDLTGGTVGANQTICSGTSPNAFTESSSATGTNQTYQWQSSNDGLTFFNNSLPTTSTYAVTESLSSLKFYRRITTAVVNNITLTANSNIIEVTIITAPEAPTSIDGFSNACQTQAGIPYNIKEVTNATGYTWSYSGTNATINDSVNAFTMSMNFTELSTSGDLTVSANNLCGVSPPSPIYNITVYPLPKSADTITGDSVVCQNQNDVTYAIPPIINANDYKWQYSGTGAKIYGTTETVTINFSHTATSGILTVAGKNNCNEGPVSSEFSITVNEMPQGTLSGNSICTGDTRNGQLTWVDSSGAAPYTIIYNDGIADRTQANVMDGVAFDCFTNPTATTNYSLVAVASNNCTRNINFIGNAATVNVSSQIATIVTEPTNTAACSGNNTSFSVSDLGAYSYQWQVSINGGANFSNITTEGLNPRYANFNTANLDLLEVAIENSSNQYQCIITASCGSDLTSLPATLTVNPLPDSAGIIIGKSVTCQKENGVVYTIPPILNATDYIWEYSESGVTLTVTSNTVTLDFSLFAISGNLTVTGVSPFCSGTASEKFIITVTQSPVSAGLIEGSHDVCQNQKEVFFKIPILHDHSLYDDPTFTWEYTGTGVTYSDETDPVWINFSENATSGILTVKRKQSCGFGQVSADFEVNVHPAPLTPQTIIQDIAECQYNYSISSITNATSYIWKYTGEGANILGSTNTISINFSADATSGYLTVQGSNEFCDGPISETKSVGVTCITGVENLQHSSKTIIFPNPSNGVFNLQITNAHFTNLTLSISDTYGKEVYTLTDNNNSREYNKTINLENIAKGLYIVRLTTNEKIQKFRIVIL